MEGVKMHNDIKNLWISIRKMEKDLDLPSLKSTDFKDFQDFMGYYYWLVEEFCNYKEGLKNEMEAIS